MISITLVCDRCGRRGATFEFDGRKSASTIDDLRGSPGWARRRLERNGRAADPCRGCAKTADRQDSKAGRRAL